MPYREARSVAESSEGPTASKSDRTGRNPGMTRLVRRSSAGVCVFSLAQTLRQRMRKCSGSSIPSLPKKKLTCWFFFFFFLTSNWHFSWFDRHKRNERTVRVWSCLRQRRELVSCRLGRLKCSVVNMAVHEWSCLSGLSVDEFQDLLTQSGQVLKAKAFNRGVILLVGLGGPTLMKKTMKWESGVFPCHGMAELPRILFGHERAYQLSCGMRYLILSVPLSLLVSKEKKTIQGRILYSGFSFELIYIFKYYVFSMYLYMLCTLAVKTLALAVILKFEMK